ncbi:MAG: HDOD domain-containing protein [Lautropia sp.]
MNPMLDSVLSAPDPGAEVARGYAETLPPEAQAALDAEESRRRLVADTLERLDESLALRGELPVFSGAAMRISQAIRGAETDVGELSRVILSDPALTTKVLRLANSAMYQSLGKEITTASRALMVLGVDVIAQLAASLKVVESYAQAARSNEGARPIVAKAMMAGALSARLAPLEDPVRAEVQMVTSVLYGFGQLLCAFYLPDDWNRIQAAVDSSASTLSIADACRQVIGMTDRELAAALVERWAMPAGLAGAIGDCDERHCVVAEGTNAIAEAVRCNADPLQLEAICERWSDALEILPSTIVREVTALRSDPAFESMVEETLGAGAGGFGRRVKPADAHARLVQALARLDEGATAEPKDERPGAAISRVLNRHMEAVHLAFGALRSILFVLQPKAGRYAARVGYGAVDDELDELAFPTAFSSNLFMVSIAARRVVIVGDASDAEYRRRLPAFVRTNFADAGACALVPVVRAANVPMLLYMDWSRRCTATEAEAEVLREWASRVAHCLERAQSGTRA